MDLCTFGCCAVVLKPPPHINKGALSPRGWIGTFSSTDTLTLPAAGKSGFPRSVARYVLQVTSSTRSASLGLGRIYTFLSYNPEIHNRTKHVARRHFFIRDMVEAFELNVPLVSTVHNFADFFTKASMRNKIMDIKSTDR